MTADQSPVNAETFRRRFPRRRFQRPLGLLFLGSYLISEAREIGEGGMLIKSNLPLKVSGQLVMTFFIPDEAFVSVTAVVVYETAAKLFGVRFTNLTFEAKRAIRDYIAEKSSLEANEEKSA